MKASVDGDDKRYKFSGHQTFTFRYGWLEKGVRGVDLYSNVFARDDALVLLGVGKNMVESIRHWCQVTQLVETDPEVKGNTGQCLRVTEIGKRLLLGGGWDPFLENDASLWLIHWLLVSNPTIGTGWQLLFSKFHRPDFTKRELVDYIAAFVEKESLKASEGVIERDVDCLIRTYAIPKSTKKQANAEETFDCPLLQLDLIQPSPDGDLYRFAIGPKSSLPALTFAYALYQYFERTRSGLSTLGVQECLYGVGSPGQAFKLDENSLIDLLEELEDMSGGDVRLDETAGLKQIYRQPGFEPMKLLDRCYRGDSSGREQRKSN